MRNPPSRRDALKQLGVAGAGLVVTGTGVIRGQANDIVIAGQPVEISVLSLSPSTVRITVRPLQEGTPQAIPLTGALERDDVGTAVATSRAASALARVRSGDLSVRFTNAPPTLHVETANGTVVQQLTLDAAAP